MGSSNKPSKTSLSFIVPLTPTTTATATNGHSSPLINNTQPTVCSCPPTTSHIAEYRPLPLRSCTPTMPIWAQRRGKRSRKHDLHMTMGAVGGTADDATICRHGCPGYGSPARTASGGEDRVGSGADVARGSVCVRGGRFREWERGGERGSRSQRTVGYRVKGGTAIPRVSNSITVECRGRMWERLLVIERKDGFVVIYQRHVRAIAGIAIAARFAVRGVVVVVVSALGEGSVTDTATGNWFLRACWSEKLLLLQFPRIIAIPKGTWAAIIIRRTA